MTKFSFKLGSFKINNHNKYLLAHDVYSNKVLGINEDDEIDFIINPNNGVYNLNEEYLGEIINFNIDPRIIFAEQAVVYKKDKLEVVAGNTSFQIQEKHGKVYVGDKPLILFCPISKSTIEQKTGLKCGFLDISYYKLKLYYDTKLKHYVFGQDKVHYYNNTILYKKTEYFYPFDIHNYAYHYFTCCSGNVVIPKNDLYRDDPSIMLILSVYVHNKILRSVRCEFKNDELLLNKTTKLFLTNHNEVVQHIKKCLYHAFS